MRLANPVLPGFHPDPSVCRVGGDFYLATSSFEYFPGVPIFHSRDLAHWRPLGHVLDRPGQLDLRGVAPSDGVYAPTLRHHAGRFYLATTVKPADGRFRNFFVTATDPAGPWSDPVWVRQGGIDPSLFFDEDGRVYWTGNGTGWAPVRGIYQSRIDPASGEIEGEPRLVWTGTGGAYPEAPHLFRRGAWYYLVVAEGGTAEGHMVTVARAREPFGPFESCPRNPVLSHRSLMTTLTSTGHADFFTDANGDWWVAFLAIRPATHGFHPLGRETCVAPVEWSEDGWPVVNGGRPVGDVVEVDRDLPSFAGEPAAPRDAFTGPGLGPAWVHLRHPEAGAVSVGGGLRLACGAPTLDDRGGPAAVFRRQQHFVFTATAELDFAPRAENEEAGLVLRLDEAHHAELVVTKRAGRRVGFLRRRIGSVVATGDPQPLGDGPVTLRVTGDRETYRFAIGDQPLGAHEVRYLCTEVAGGYTGVMVGLHATGRGVATGLVARFPWFEYRAG
jgi:alpha-N-arabinofuranosidase